MEQPLEVHSLEIFVPFTIKETKWKIHLTVHDLGSDNEYVQIESAISPRRSQSPEEWENTIEKAKVTGEFWQAVLLQLRITAFLGIVTAVAQA